MTVIFDGIASGMLLFLIGVGLSVTLGLMNFINLAHGAFAMFGGYLCVSLLNRADVPFLAALPLAAAGTALIGLVFERTLYRRLYSATHFDQVLFSIGLVFMSISTAHYFFGAQQQPLVLPDFLRGQIHLPGLDMGVYRLFLIVLGLAIAFGLQRLVSSTHFGAQLRASVDNPRAARGVGIDVERVFTLTFALGTALASLVNLFAPEAIIFGGSMGEEGERLIKATRHTLKKRALEVLERDIQVELCSFGQQAGVTGAVAVTLHNHYTSFEEKAAAPVS